ncbi:Pleiotropic drug resistance ABC transporter protein [Mycena venus]|uniref:Pleiotropic drug resistance ABC transporter protein n=1 Tax=Mycena venus TaxID=2733690 RepID=A0A8H6XAC0_9AGAR|nr:Pleiotropic drug resistance ABC transporter protein [Mycena venus]
MSGQSPQKESSISFFNIYLSANHPINSNVPEDFVPLPPYDLVDVIHDDFDPGDYVSPPSIHEINGDFSEHAPGGEFIFNCRGPNGAILALPHGSHLQKLRNLETVQRYAAKHAESWYKYANETRGRGLVNGSLYLVTGCEKARSWGMASFREVSLEKELQLSFRPTTDADNGYRYRWRGTHCRHKHADSPSVDGAPLNQTTFIHAFAISLSEGIWGMRFGDVKICQLTDSPFPDKSGRSFIPYGSQGSSFAWSLFFGGTTGGGKQCTGQAPGNGIISNASPIPQVFHPSQIIHERILREAPEAKVVITHDDDWSDIFRNDGMQTTGKSSSDLQEAIFDRFEIITADGTAFLKSKSDPTRSSANPVTKPPSETGSIPILTPSLSSSSTLKDGATENVADEQSIDGDRSTLDQSQENRDKAHASQTYLDSTTIDVTLPSPETSLLRSRYIQPQPPKRRASIRTNTAERRATHNALERMRRETLNGRFLALASLLPPPTGPYDPPRRRHQRSPSEPKIFHCCESKLSSIFILSQGAGSSTLDTPSSPFPPSPELSPTNSIPSPSIEPSPTSAIPSPTHSAHDPRSLILPLYTGPFLDLPQMHGQPLRGSETLSNRSSTPNVDWAVNASHMLSGSSDTSSVRSPSPNTEWDPASPFGNSHLEDPMPNAQDEDSPKASSSNETARAADRQGEELRDLAQRLQLQDRAGLAGGSLFSG